jgi:hypothetical protein
MAPRTTLWVGYWPQKARDDPAPERPEPGLAAVANNQRSDIGQNHLKESFEKVTEKLTDHSTTHRAAFLYAAAVLTIFKSARDVRAAMNPAVGSFGLNFNNCD